MKKKPMTKKAAWITLAVVIATALLVGFVLVNKGDGPVAGLLLANRTTETVQDYSTAAQTRDGGVYRIVSNAFNRFQVDFSVPVPADRDLYANVHCVECPEGSAFTGRWVRDGSVILEETATLTTGPKGVIAYRLPAENVLAGNYTFELYNSAQKIFESAFQIG